MQHSKHSQHFHFTQTLGSKFLDLKPYTPNTGASREFRTGTDTVQQRSIQQLELQARTRKTSRGFLF